MPNQKISQLNINTTPTGADMLPIVNSGETKQISFSALTSFVLSYVTGSTDTYVTGGTYNNSTGIAEFTNNTGGTFSISGFYTGATDVYITGGTYSEGSATFTNNTGGTFTVSNFFTGSTFTGNTSGDCITNLYVSNLNSCSPLHIQPTNTGDVYINENGGKVGIGTTTPSAQLSLVKANDGVHLLKLTSDGYDLLAARLGSFDTTAVAHTFNGIGGGNFTFIADTNPFIRLNTVGIGETLNIGGSIPTLTTTRPTMVIDTPLLGIGIGYPATSAKVHIVGNDTTSGSYALKVDNSGSSINIISARNDGNVGIGTSTPTDKLSVYTNKTATSTSTPDSINLGGTFSNAAGTNLKFKIYDDGGSIGGFGISSGQLDYKSWSTGADHVFYGDTNKLVTFKGTGEVGIGIASPSAKLEISGNTKLSSTAYNYKIGLYDALGITQGAASPNINVGHGNTINDADNGGGIVIGTFATSSSDGIAIGLSSFVGIGTSDGIAIGRSATVNNASIRGVAIGREALVSGSNAFAIGNYTTASQDDTIILGNNASGNKPNVGIGTSTPTSKLDISGFTGYNQLRMRTAYTPTSSADANGNIGDIAWDDDYNYTKTSTGWKRSPLSSF